MSASVIPQIPGQLPEGYGLHSMLTPAQFAIWQQEPESTVRKRLDSLPGIIKHSRKSIRIHPKTFLELTFGRPVE